MRISRVLQLKRTRRPERRASIAIVMPKPFFAVAPGIAAARREAVPASAQRFSGNAEISSWCGS
jgi:hypothetical protein